MDCADKSDEESCPGQVPGTIPPQGGCPPGQYRCVNDSCLPSLLRCDGVADCPEGEDEYSCREFAFACASVKLRLDFFSSDISKLTSQGPSFCLPQLCSNANWENWCVTLRPVVFHLTSVATTPLTACRFTLMNPAAMVTCSLAFNIFSITHTAVDDFPASLLLPL